NRHQVVRPGARRIDRRSIFNICEHWRGPRSAAWRPAVFHRPAGGIMLLDGKVAIVTGSGTGLGRAYAMGLAGAGAKVVVNSRTAENVAAVVEEIRRTGGIAEGCAASVAGMEGARKIVQTAMEKFGRLDILVNNAGITGRKNLVDMTEQDFDDVIATNLKGTFACTRHAVPHMIRQGQGRIINMSSGSILGQEGATSYAASKGGVLNISLTWAVELARYGITCNAIRTSAATRLNEKRRQQAKQAALERNGRQLTDADLGYFQPGEAAPLVVFLASDQAHWITGQFICIDGPRLAVCEHTHHAKTAVMPGGWTAELLLEHFRAAVGTPLQAFGFLTPDGRKIL
ncbi:MAG: SDR family NAD(P)-dependent oxidoreductase, partial [Thermodesulfobacteriota bacterium]